MTPEPTPQTPVRAIPEHLREYRLLARLGEGGMGTVYKAVHTRLDRVVALKVLPAQRTDDPEAVARFRREMRAVGRLNHPNIVQATDAGEVEGIQFLVMDRSQGPRHVGVAPAARQRYKLCKLVNRIPGRPPEVSGW
jgi:hypothetical protein